MERGQEEDGQREQQADDPHRQGHLSSETKCHFYMDHQLISMLLCICKQLKFDLINISIVESVLAQRNCGASNSALAKRIRNFIVIVNCPVYCSSGEYHIDITFIEI